jgi:hypothetical protein
MDHRAGAIHDRAIDGAESLLSLQRPSTQTEDSQTNQDNPHDFLHFNTPLTLDSIDLALPWMYHIRGA